MAGVVIKKKLTATERLLDERMLRMLESATKRPKAWHKIADQMKAAELLAKRGVVEVWHETKLYRLKQS